MSSATSTRTGIGEIDDGLTASAVDKLTVKLMQQTDISNDLQTQLVRITKDFTDTKRLLYMSRKDKEDSDRQVEALSTEIEELSATLFDEANIKVKEANIEANDTKVKNDRLVATLKERDDTIDLLRNELNQLKEMIGNISMEKNLETVQTDSEMGLRLLENDDALFSIDKLTSFNNKQIYSPIYNQLRFDLHPYNQFKRAISSSIVPYQIRDTSFFKNLLLEEIEPTLRIDKIPSIKFYQRKSFIPNLMDLRVTIEPLSASTEVWKSSNSSSSPSLSPDLKMFKYETDRPIAISSKCCMCSEDRREMNFARLYKLKLKDAEYNLCIACSNKFRTVVELLKYLKNIKPTNLEDSIMAYWCEIVKLRVKLYYSKITTWNENDQCGLVYGWKNSWLGQDSGLNLSRLQSNQSASTAVLTRQSSVDLTSMNNSRQQSSELNSLANSRQQSVDLASITNNTQTISDSSIANESPDASVIEASDSEAKKEAVKESSKMEANNFKNEKGKEELQDDEPFEDAKTD